MEVKGGTENTSFQPAEIAIEQQPTMQQQQQYSMQQQYSVHQQYSQQQYSQQQYSSTQSRQQQFTSGFAVPPVAAMGGSLNTAPVTLQPTGMPAPDGILAGLDYLSQVDQLVVQQQIELLEMFTGFETANKYIVRNSVGQQVYYVVEDTDCCTRQCCGPARPFDIRIMDNQQREVIHLSRPLRCQCCCCFCCLQELEVSVGGQVIGIVQQDWTLVRPQFSVKRPDGSTVLRISGPICPCSCGSDVEFHVLTNDSEHEVGKITKQWTGFAQEMFTDADVFGITFPLDLETNVKATLLGALFLIDFMFFEQKKNNNN